MKLAIVAPVLIPILQLKYGSIQLINAEIAKELVKRIIDSYETLPRKIYSKK